jgi:hypothetical protein
MAPAGAQGSHNVTVHSPLAAVWCPVLRAVSQDRDDLLEQRETTRTYTASTLSNGSVAKGHDSGGGPFSKWHLFAPRNASPQAAGPPEAAVNGHALGDPADAAIVPD